ncbi:proteasome regulatory particle subunit [Stygiomarasmius scandens]|uniref:Proteasome regulatory particle subunit n=1 Tax=Marasmiellus scandens TaxID=2682957 RepID=A0ABR1JZ75_9AGAR
MPSSSSRLTNAVSNLNPLRRRPSLAESIRSVASSLSIASNPSTSSSADKKDKSKPKSSSKSKHKALKIARSPSYYRSYSVYSQTMFPIILREPEVTQKLLEAILESPGGKRSLSRIARTCKAFKEPALDVLWRELDSLIPIIGLFPSSLLKRPKKPGLGLSKAPSEGDWDKIIEYGARVRKIKYDQSSNNAPSSILPMFEENRPVEYIFPNLQRLVWKAETSAGLDYCRLFLNSELQSLSLEVVAGSRSQTLSTILRDVTSRMKLQALSLILPTTLPDSFVDLVSAQTGLQKLVLIAPGALSTGVGRLAASLPELKSLQLDLSHRNSAAVEAFFDDLPQAAQGSGQSTPSSEVSVGRDSGVFSGDETDFSFVEMKQKLNSHLKTTGAFASLRQLHLTGEASCISIFLKHFFAPLVQLELVIEDPPEPSDWQELSQLLSARLGRSLQALTISATGSSRFSDLVRSTSRAEPPDGRLSLEHFGSLPMLNRLEIDLPSSFQFTETDIVCLASSCPGLEELKLCSLARFPLQTGPPKLTLQALAPLMAGCPKLHTLSVAVNARQASPEVLAQKSASSESLRRLHVGHSWIHDFIHVTILLSHLAPRLDSLKWFHEKNRPGFIETHARGWEKVQDALPHLQSVRLMERERVQQPVMVVKHIPPPAVPTAEVGVQASVMKINQGVLVRPQTTERAVEAIMKVANQAVQVRPDMHSVFVHAKPNTAEASVGASVSVGDKSVSAHPELVSKSVDAPANVTNSVEASLPASKPNGENQTVVHSPFQSFVIPSFFGLFSLVYRIFIGYPISIPFRIMHAIFHRLPLVGGYVGRFSSQDTDISMESLQDTDKNVATSITGDKFSRTIKLRQSTKFDEKSSVWEQEVTVRFWLEQRDHESCEGATRHLAFLTSSRYNMSDNRKQEKDYTPEVDALLPEAKSLVQAGKLQEGLDKLFALEKQARNAADLASTTRLAKAILEHCYNARDHKRLNESLSILSKKHGQLKAAIQAMVEQAMGWLEDIKKKDGTERWLELVETLREVTEGKIFLETPRARVTLLLSKYHEGLSKTAKTEEERKKALETASELLSDLQVETYSSMERREKTEFILEQMRLLIAVARQKDEETKAQGKDSLSGGETEWVKVRVGGRKVNEGFLKEKENEDLKLKYYDLMIQHALKHSSYLDAAKYYHKVWETPSIKEDVNDKGKAALEHIVYYVILAPHDNEQSDMLHRLFIDPALDKLPLHYNLVKCFTTQELMRWPGIEQLYGEFLRQTPVFSIEKRWEDLHTRIIEHNIRVVAAYYTRITLKRLTSLLDLSEKQTEETLARLVVSKTIWARIDRPAGVVSFRSQRSPEDVMNDWSSDMQKLLSLVEKTWMGMNAAQAAQSRIKAASS